MNTIGFWGTHGKYGVFSNFYKANFEVDGITFNCVEQYMMYSKAKLFCNKDIAEQIMQESEPKEIKRLGRKVLGFNDVDWNEVKEEIVYTAVKAKFNQNEKLKSILLNTGNSILAEASPYDRIWGIGTNIPEEVQDKSKWKGQNLLGKILMKVRTELS